MPDVSGHSCDSRARSLLLEWQRAGPPKFVGLIHDLTAQRLLWSYLVSFFSPFCSGIKYVIIPFIMYKPTTVFPPLKAGLCTPGVWNLGSDNSTLYIVSQSHGLPVSIGND